MKGLIKITFLIGALALTACSKSVNGDAAGGGPKLVPVGGGGITYITPGSPVATQTFENVFKRVTKESGESIYQAFVMNRAVLNSRNNIEVILPNNIYDACYSSMNSPLFESCSPNFLEGSPKSIITFFGQNNTRCDYQLLTTSNGGSEYRSLYQDCVVELSGSNPVMGLRGSNPETMLRLTLSYERYQD